MNNLILNFTTSESPKNTIIKNNGFSLSQSVFGRNPILPNVLDNKLPTKEKETSARVENF